MRAIELFSSLAFLAALTSGVKIQCDYFLLDFAYYYTCEETIISIDNPATATEISGNHLEGKGNVDVKVFLIGNRQILEAIPNGIGKFLPNVEIFSSWRGNCSSVDSSVDSSVFEHFSNLLSIELAFHRIVTLESDLFQHTPEAS